MGDFVRTVVLAVGSAVCSGATFAQPTPLETRTLAATCANCHGTDGKAVAGSALVSLAGMKQEYLSQQMKAFKSGQRSATVMHQLAKGYSDEQIDQIAAYFANQR